MLGSAWECLGVLRAALPCSASLTFSASSSLGRYVCFVRHDIGAYFNPSGAPAHWVHHHWGQIAGAKAWEGKLWNEPAHLRGEASKRLGANLEYLSRLAPSPTREDTAACGEPMRALRRSAEAHPLTRHYASTSHIQYHASRFAVF